MQATLTILFTDAVASTEALARLGDEEFGRVQEAHLELLRGPINSNDGREVKSLGDGLMVAFTGAADALACAVAMQQAVEAAARGGEQGLPLRVGVSAGDVTLADDGDVSGTAVVEASRLCAAAGGGQVLATETVRVLAGSRGGHAFSPLGPVALKGLSEPVMAVEVGWAPIAEGDLLAPVPLPPRLASESSWEFCGRTGEIGALGQLWQAVVDGSQKVALLGGEPGAGKTRLAREVAVRAQDEGALVLFGRVDEDAAVAYQPFAEALRHYLSNVDEETRAGVLGLRGGALARLAPELSDEAPTGPSDALTLFDAFADWLSGESRRRPVLLILDDLHWAGRPTLQALLNLVRSERLGRVLIICTYRDTELGRKHPLSENLADLRRVEGVERLPVRGLDHIGVEQFVRSALDGSMNGSGQELVEVLSEQTQGNPFFISQVLSHIRESGAAEQAGSGIAVMTDDLFEVPEGVRDVVGRRVSHLSEKAGELLTVAAVAGLEFDTAVVAEVACQDTSDSLDGFDEAIAARLVFETDTPGRLRFAHALVRQTLEEELSTLRRIHLHRDLGLAIERRFPESATTVIELAHHFAEAAAVGQGKRATAYAERAAGQARERGAPGQAADFLRRALELLPADDDRDGRWRDRLYAQLASCLYTQYDLERLEVVARDWMALALEHDDYGMRVYATVWLVVSGTWKKARESEDLERIAATLRIDPATVRTEGARRLSWRGGWCETDQAGLRALLLGTIAYNWDLGYGMDELAGELPADDPLSLTQKARELAAASRDPDIADEVEWNRLSAMIADPDAAALSREAERVIELGFSVGGGGRIELVLANARLGRLDEVLAIVDGHMDIAREKGDRVIEIGVWCARTNEALLRGRFDDAKAAMAEASRIAAGEPSLESLMAMVAVGRQIAMGQFDQARLIAEDLDQAEAFDYSYIVGAIATAQGDLETARSALAYWERSGHPLAAKLALPARLWGLSVCAHAVGDEDAARRLYEPLTDYDGQLLLVTMAFFPASAAYVLGLLAETFGEPERAAAHFRDALEFEQRIGAVPLADQTRDALARLGASA
ncbi:MAG: AAA family ATPase [Solirubrobacterales bacterium]|nr:AAA family ATPase [Solirubrobacterales bacterium]